ncbi:ribonuclease H-like domain-containing protein, partial [Tanacetum coccineum]
MGDILCEGRDGNPPLAGDNSLVVLISNLDAGNPLHVYNSDNSSSILVPFKLLGTENYRMWNNAMKLALQARNKYGFVDGTCLRDSYVDSDVLFDGSIVYNLLQKVGSVKQGGSTVVDYYHKLNSL